MKQQLSFAMPAIQGTMYFSLDVLLSHLWITKDRSSSKRKSILSNLLQ